MKKAFAALAVLAAGTALAQLVSPFRWDDMFTPKCVISAIDAGQQVCALSGTNQYAKAYCFNPDGGGANTEMALGYADGGPGCLLADAGRPCENIIFSGGEKFYAKLDERYGYSAVVFFAADPNTTCRIYEIKQ